MRFTLTCEVEIGYINRRLAGPPVIENHSIFQQDVKMDNHSFMKELIENPGHCQIVRNISSFLDIKSLAQCRLVCQAWRDLIDNDRPWLVFQLEHIHDQQKTFINRYATEDKQRVKTTIKERFPEWYAFIQQISRKQSIPRLKEIVRQLWIYSEDTIIKNLTPLHHAIGRYETEFVQLLVDCGIDLTMTDADQWTPLHYACKSGGFAMVQLLLKHHQPTFETTLRIIDGQTIFQLAAYNQDPQVLKLMIQFLLESGLNIRFHLEARTEEGDTILHQACNERDIDIVDTVIKALEEVNSDIDFDTRNYQHDTPLHCACRNHKSDVAIQLLQRFPQKIHVLGYNDAHILHYACQFGHLELIKYMASVSDFNIDFNITMHDGWTPLHLASLCGHYEVVQFLFQHYDAKGIDVTKTNNSGKTAEDLAIHQDILEVLRTWKNQIK